MPRDLMTWLCMGALLNAAGDAAGGGGGGGSTSNQQSDDKGGDTKPEPTFNQKQLDEIIATRLRKADAERSKLEKRIEELSPLAKQVEELQHQLQTKGKSEDEKKAIETDREMKRLQKQLEELSGTKSTLEKERDTAKASLTTYMIENAVTSALVSSKVLPNAVKDAVKLLAADTNARIEEGPDGKPRLVFEVDGLTVHDAKQAAEKWLKTHAWFVAHPGGGSDQSGTRGPSGAQLLTLDGQSPEDLIRMGLSAPKH